MKAREYKSPLIEELINETTPEELNKIDKQMEQVKDKQWFIDRVGKRIFRKNNNCSCPICLDVFENGLVIGSEMHAIYLYDCQETGLIYYDKE
jgi:hypothetical protein